MPLGISFCILLLGLRNKSRSAVLSSILLLGTFSNGFIALRLWEWIEHPWQRIEESQAPSADAIVVLSSGGRHPAPGKANIMEWKDPDRFISGIKLFQEKKAPKLFFTGGASPYYDEIKTEGDLYKEEAIRLGLPPSAIKTTDPVFNTTQEALEIRKRFKLDNDNSPSKILLITSAFHMQRAKRQFERQGFIVHPFPVDFQTKNISKRSGLVNPYSWIPNSGNLYMSSKALRELLGRVFYRSW